ncbi:MAG: tetraacyldisaccharide 4'-kinase [Acidobacteria bacterium]|nr:tetraacyldisaccharide 4'-kinase [Acidobacteriota bacterium]
MSLLSGLYGRAARFRRAWYGRHPDRTRQLAQPVISVGNLVLGGSGKTPVVSTIARLLLAAGERPVILSRGYGRLRKADGVVVVSDGREVLAPTPQSGDEPQMLARALPGVPVLVSPDRYLAGCLAERTFGCTVHLLDDGFQHVQLARDINLLVVSKADLDERLLPSGRLREPLGAAAAADALLVSGGEEDAAAVAARLGAKPLFHMTPRYDQPRLVEPFGAPLPASVGRRTVAVAGIARPERFFAALRAEGWNVVEELVFRDHHRFTSRDLESIRRAAVDARADLVLATEKDAARLDSHVARARSGDGEPAWAFLPLQVGIEPTLAFAAWMNDQLSAARRDGPLQRTVQAALAGRVAQRPDPGEGGEAA